MTFIDTNYFLRYLLNDIPKHYLEAKKLFLAGSERKISLITSSIVFFEVFWVLKSFYNLNKENCILALKNILKLSFVHLRERDVLKDALMLFEKTSLDLEDCYNIYYAKAQGIKSDGFKTFDKKLEKEFNRIKG